MTRSKTSNAASEKKRTASTLLDIIEKIIRDNGGVAPLRTIYSEVIRIRPNVKTATIRAVIRDACLGTLRRATAAKPRFIRIKKGVYAIYGFRPNDTYSKTITDF
ncbi:MAG: hypothetical protein QXD95_09255 [Nitrososphaeria archaeon]